MQSYCFLDQPEKYKLGRGHWELAFCQVSLNSIQWFHRRSQKCLSQSEDRAAILFFWSARKNASLVEDVEILLPVKFCWILFSGFRGKVENASANHRPGRLFCFSDPPEKHKLGRGRWDLASYQVSSNYFYSFRGEVENVSANQRPGRPFCFFQICLKNTNVVEGIESLLPVKFRWIPFSGFGEVENVSANQRPGWPSCFSDRPKKHKLGRGCWDLASYQGSLNSVQRFQRRSRKCLGQSKARAAILFFRSVQKTQTW